MYLTFTTNFQGRLYQQKQNQLICPIPALKIQGERISVNSYYIIHMCDFDLIGTKNVSCRLDQSPHSIYTMHVVRWLCNKRYGYQTHVNSTFANSRLFMVCFSVAQSFWNFTQVNYLTGMVVINERYIDNSAIFISESRKHYRRT